MIDIHSHLVYGVDDGSKTIEDTIYMLKEAKKSGIYRYNLHSTLHGKLLRGTM